MIPDIQAFKTSLAEQRGKKCVFIKGKCPGELCPAWWKTQWNQATVEGVTSEIVEGCSFRLTQLYMQEMIRSSDRTSATVNDKANEQMQTQKAAAVHVAQALTSLSRPAEALPSASEEK